jgi:putative ABC transport system permease protein
MEHLKLTFRQLKRNPLLLYFTIPGLAVGLCAFLLLAVYLKFELSFDKHFPNGDRVVRLCNKTYLEGDRQTLSIALRTDYTQLPSQVPEIEKAVQMYHGWKSTIITETGKFNDLFQMWADPEFFDVFGLKLIQGNTGEALAGKTSVVLTRSTALKLFGTVECVGKSFKLDDSQLFVTGVMNDIPKTTHFKFDLLTPMASNEFMTRQGSLEFSTYYLLKKGTSKEKADQKIAAVNDKLMEIWKQRGSLNNTKTETYTESLHRIHLHTQTSMDQVPKTDMSQLLIVVGIAFLIFLMALINYINMYLLHGEKRISEIAIRKVSGASKGDLSFQFYYENGVIALIALLLGLGLAVLVQPLFAKMIDMPLTTSDMFTPLGIVLIVTILSLLVILSGAYPSVFLSKIDMVSGLKGKRLHISKGRFSKTVVLVQFFITVLLISSVVIIRAQIKHLKDVPLGFDINNVTSVQNFSDLTMRNSKNIKMELEKLPFIQSVGVSQHRMGGRCSGQSIALANSTDEKPIKEYRVFPGFCENMRLQLKDGGFFDANTSGNKGIILNEAAMKMLGLTFTPGMQVFYKGEPAEVRGVVKDFYFDGNAGNPIDPLVLTRVLDYAGVMYLRTNQPFTADNRKRVAAVFNQFDPENVVSFTPLGDLYKAKFTKEERVFSMVSSGACLAIILSFVGILSLSLMNVDRRTKEIGIRKVAGSSEREIMVKLLSETLLLVTIASLFAFGVAYYLMRQWLNGFAVRIHLHPGYFLLSGLFAFVIVLLAVSWQSWRAATRNPVEALRYE